MTKKYNNKKNFFKYEKNMKDYLNHELIFHILSYIFSSTIDTHLTFSKNLYFHKIYIS